MQSSIEGLIVHDPDGDMGYGEIVGAFESFEAAGRKAEQIERVSRIYGHVEAIVLPIRGGSTGAHATIERVKG